MTIRSIPRRARCGMTLCVLFAALGLAAPLPAQRTTPKRTAADSTKQLRAVPGDSAAGSFNAAAVSLIKERCAGCHGGRFPKAGLNLEPAQLVAAMRDVPSRQIDSLMLLDTRRPERSYFLMKIRGDKGIKKARMPINAPALSTAEVGRIERWMRFVSRHPRGPRPAPAAADSARKR